MAVGIGLRAGMAAEIAGAADVREAVVVDAGVGAVVGLVVGAEIAGAVDVQEAVVVAGGGTKLLCSNCWPQLLCHGFARISRIKRES